MRRAIAAAAALLCLLLAACSQQNDPVESGSPSGQGSEQKRPYNEEDVKTLLDAGIFSEEPEQLDLEIACGLVGVDEGLVESCRFYLPTSTNAEALALFVLKDAGDAESVKAACEGWIGNQIESYSSYGPEHVPKLEGAVLRVRENTVLVVVGADPAAAQSAVNALDG